MFCKKCGGKIESYASHCPFCGEPLENNQVQAIYTTNDANTKIEHKSIGDWFLTYFLLSIPIVGFIMLLIWAYGDESKNNPTFRNWARFQLIPIYCVLGIGLIIITFIFIAIAAK